MRKVDALPHRGRRLMIRQLHRRARLSASQAICALGIHRLFERRFGGVGSILTFHRVGEAAGSHSYWSQKFSVRPDYFRRLIEMLIDRDYEIVSMTEVAQRLAGKSPSGRKFVCLSFDDGYRDNYDVAFPICASFGIPMVVHVTTGFVRRADPMWWLGLEQIIVENDVLEFPQDDVIRHHPALTPAQKRKAFDVAANLLVAAPRQRRRQVCEELGANYGVSFTELTDRNTLTPGMMQEMRASGLVEFGAHTVSHANLSRLPAADARAEIAESRHDLEDLLGDEVRHFAFPYGGAGEAGPREFGLCRELGFETAATTRKGNLFPGHCDRMQALPRLTIGGEYQDMSAAEVLLSGTYSALRHGLARL
jgi:peptidoglycan/xylan/chitin deacetylase (PgdA/CDA1 family)